MLFLLIYCVVVVEVVAVVVDVSVVVVGNVPLLMPVVLDPVAMLFLVLELLPVSELVESVISVLELLVLDSLVVSEEIAALEVVDRLVESVFELELGFEDDPSMVISVVAIWVPWLAVTGISEDFPTDEVEEAISPAPGSEVSLFTCADVVFGRTVSVIAEVDMDEFCPTLTVEISEFPVAESEIPTVVIGPHFSSSLLGLYHSMACPKV